MVFWMPMLKSLEVELTPVIIIKSMTVQTSTCMAMVFEPCLFDSCKCMSANN